MSSQLRRAGIATAALLFGACGPRADVPRTGRTTHGIFFGEPENGHEGVVMLQVSLDGGAALCTGTLVAPRVVVTAKHCTDGGDPDDMLISTGPSGTRDYYDVEEVRETWGGMAAGLDFAVLILQTEIDAEPYPYEHGWDPEQGEAITLVGYGRRDDGDAGRKYLGDNELDYVFDDYFTTVGEAACNGDSGGPAFDSEGVLVGVIVNTIGGWDGGDSCADGISGMTRVDAWADMVDEAVLDAWVCDGADEETCADGRDNDCDQIIDNGCLGVGEICSDSVYCDSGDCRDLGDGARCTRDCDVMIGARACPEGYYCAQISCGAGACVPGVGGELPIGAACDADTDCQNLACLDVGGRRACLRPCGVDDDCGAAELCTSGPEPGCGGCEPSAEGEPFGAPCSEPEECGSGACVADASGSFCSGPCGDGCPDGFDCGPDELCVRQRPDGEAEMGAPCGQDAECRSGLCSDFAVGKACSEYCDARSICPGGYACVARDGVEMCEPQGTLSGGSCDDNDDCLSGLCGHFGGLDVCTQRCSADEPCPGDLLCIDASSAGDLCRPAVVPASSRGGGGCASIRGRPNGRAWHWLVVCLLFGVGALRRRA